MYYRFSKFARKMFSILEFLKFQDLDERDLYAAYKEIIPLDRNWFLLQHMDKGIVLHETPLPYESVVCFEPSRKSVSLICIILGYEQVDELSLCFLLSITSIYSNSFPRYDLCNLLARNIKQKLDDFPIVSLYIYPSFLFYFFIHQNCEYFKGLKLKMVDEQGNPLKFLNGMNYF